MKTGWQIQPLENVVTVRNGGTPKSKVKEYWGDEVEWLTPKDMGKMDGIYISSTPRKITELGLSKCSAKLAPANSVIMSTRAPIGHLAINTVPMSFNQGCRGMTPSEALDIKYLFYFLSSNVPELNALGTGATFKELSSGALKNFPIPIPPLEEQKRIVAILDEAFEGLDRARAHTEANLQNARDLFSGLLRKIFMEGQENDVSITTLGEVVSMKGGGTPSKKNDKFWNGTIPWVSPKDMKFEYISKSRDHITEDALVKSAANEIPVGSSLIVVRSGILARTVPTGVTTVRLAVNQDIKALIPSSKIHSEYLGYFMRAVEPVLLDKVTRGATVHRLATDSLKELEIHLPTISKQQKNVDIIRKQDVATENLVAHYQTKLADLDDLRQSLLQKAFAGELT